ncbi:MAG: hypothetical protein Q9162_004617 [Coniocarpon cinnabarinum]
MKTSSGLASLGLALLSHLATPVAAQQSTAITGAPDGQVQPRLEIRQMEASNPDQWNLFLLATAQFQNTSHEDIMGWYQLAGIHGMPYEPWNGVSGTNPGQGYCPHSMAIFICWHRAYTLAWEQQTLINAQAVVNQFQGADRARYQTALSTMRLPYWDWAEIPPSNNNADCMPPSLYQPQVTVNTPSGSQSIPNPLYAFYNMVPHDDGDFASVGGGDWSDWKTTLRYPTSQDISAQSDDRSAATNLGINNPTARAQVYRVLTACHNFLEISNDGVAEQDPNCAASLEAIHNGIHTFTGGPTNSGHMTYNNFAGFDPIFYLHHANVDRLFAMWQALNPGSYMPSTNSGGSSTFTINAQQSLDGNTPLAPFAGANGQYYTCNSVRDVTQLRYTYPELQSGNVADAVESLYGASAVAQTVSSASRSSTASSSSSTSASGSNTSSSVGSTSATATGSPSTIVTTNSQGSTITTTSVPTSGSAAGGSSTVITTDSRGSTITTVTSGSAAGGSAGSSPTTVVTTNSQGSTITTTMSGTAGGNAGSSPTTVVTTNSQGSTITTTMSGTAGVGGSASGSGSGGSSSFHVPYPTGGLGNSSSNGTNSGHDYTCHVVAEKHGLGGTFTIFGFLGNNADNSPNNWLSSPDFCGAHSVFAPIDADTSNKMLVAGHIPLTRCLQQKVAAGALSSLEEPDVLPYLAKNLQWKVATAQGKVVDNSQVPGLTVGAVSQPVSPPSRPGQLPTYGNAHLANNVTSGKPGGIQNGMQYNWWDTCASSAVPHKEL